MNCDGYHQQLIKKLLHTYTIQIMKRFNGFHLTDVTWNSNDELESLFWDLLF